MMRRHVQRLEQELLHLNGGDYHEVISFKEYAPRYVAEYSPARHTAQIMHAADRNMHRIRCKAVLERFWHELHGHHGHAASDGAARHTAAPAPTATLRLDINFDAIKDRAQFFEEVQSDLARAAGLRPEQIRILDLRAGSTVVEFSVPDTQSRSAVDILDDLKQQVKQPGSALMTGRHTRRALEMAVHRPAPSGEPKAPRADTSAHAAQKAPGGGSAGAEGHRFDAAVCREMFKDFEADKTGRLKINGLTRLGERLWDIFHPQGPRLDSDEKEVGQT